MKNEQEIVRSVFDAYIRDAKANNTKGDRPTFDMLEEVKNMAIKSLEQQPSDDVMAIHTQGLDEGIRCAMCTNSMRSDRGCDGGCVVDEDMYKKVMDTIRNLIVPPVSPTRKIGRWIYNRDIQNWVCSECSETPKTLGYCGTSAFMKEHFKFCNHCGAEMVGAENE